MNKFFIGLLLLIVLVPAGSYGVIKSGWFKNYLEDTLSQQIGREITVAGPVDVRWSWPPGLVLLEVELANADWSDQGPMLTVERLAATIKPLSLFNKRTVFPQLALTGFDGLLQRNPQGSNWAFMTEGGNSGRPVIRQLILRDGQVRYLDPERDTRLTVSVRQTDTIGDRLAAARGNRYSARFDGQGQWHGQPVQMSATTGPLLSMLADQPYPLQGELHQQENHITLQGTVTDPLRLQAADLQLSLTGAQPVQLLALFGIESTPLPNSELRAHLTVDSEQYQLSELSGQLGQLPVSGQIDVQRDHPLQGKGTLTLGQTDLTGAFSVSLDDNRPHIRGDLRSDTLAVDQLSALFGGSDPSTGSDGDIIPALPLYSPMLRRFDAELNYRADRLQQTGLNAIDVIIKLNLDQGQLQLQPLAGTLFDSRLQVRADLDGRNSPVSGTLAVEVDGLPIRQLLGSGKLAGKIEGSISAQAELQSTGDTLDRFLATAHGPVALRLQNGRLDKELVNKISLDPLEWLTSDENAEVAIECAALQADLDRGIATVQQMVIAAPDLTLTGQGRIDAGNGAVDLTIIPYSDDPGLVELTAPVRITGTLSDPQLDPSIEINADPRDGDTIDCPSLDRLSPSSG